MSIIFWDTEANGHLESATKMHCFCYKSIEDGDEEVYTVTNLGDPSTLFNEGDTWIAHNQFGYDLPLLVKLGYIDSFTTDSVTVKGEARSVQFIDTLAMSREEYPDRPTGHGLEPWSKILGTYKPQIDNWENLSMETYIERCKEDCITTEKLFLHLAEKMGIEL